MPYNSHNLLPKSGSSKFKEQLEGEEGKVERGRGGEWDGWEGSGGGGIIFQFLPQRKKIKINKTDKF